MSCSMRSSTFPASSYIFLILLICFPGYILAAVLTLHSIEIYKTHELLGAKPTVYFQCKGENKTVLPDVKAANTLYTFKGEESWQPLTELSSKKCKRCGLYEQDFIKFDDIFDEWELCPDDFRGSDGKYTRIKEQEINATFSCSECKALAADPHEKAKKADDGGKGLSVVVVLLISASVTIVSIFGFVGVYKYCQRRKRQQEQARFLKLFEEGDDIEDELGLGEVI